MVIFSEDGASQPHDFAFPGGGGTSSGVSCVPADCAAIENRWFGNDGPIADAKKSSPSTKSFAQRQ